MKVHELKCWPSQFGDVENGLKRFEVRENDRGFEAGDIVILREFVPAHLVGERMDRTEYAFKYEASGFTHRTPLGPFRIGYILVGAPLPKGWCAFELINLVRETP